MIFITLSLADLNRVFDIAREQSRETSHFELSAHSLLEAIKREMADTEVASLTETRDLMRALSFKPAHLHSDHYYKIGNRADVRYHRSLYAPLYHEALTSDNVALFNGDASFFHQNAHSALVWMPMCEKDSDLSSFGPGTGLRMNAFEFASKYGILALPDGASLKFTVFSLFNHLLGLSAGTIYPFGSTQKAVDIIAAVKRFIEAIKADKRLEPLIKVLGIDGAKVNKTLPDDAINPSKACVGDYLFIITLIYS